ALKEHLRCAPNTVGAARKVADRQYPVHIRVCCQPLRGEIVSDLAGGVGGAVHTRYNGDVVARGNSPVGSPVAEKRAPLAFRYILDGLNVFAKAVIPCKVLHSQVMRMNMVAGLDGLRGKADDLPVAADWFAGRNSPQRDLVAAANEALHGHLCSRLRGQVEDRPGLQADPGDGNVIFGMQADRNVAQRHDANRRRGNEINISDTHELFLTGGSLTPIVSGLNHVAGQRKPPRSDTCKGTEPTIHRDGDACHKTRSGAAQPDQRADQFVRFPEATSGRSPDDSLPTRSQGVVLVEKQAAILFTQEIARRYGIDPHANSIPERHRS